MFHFDRKSTSELTDFVLGHLFGYFLTNVISFFGGVGILGPWPSKQKLLNDVSAIGGKNWTWGLDAD